MDFIKSTVTRSFPKDYDKHTENYLKFLQFCEKYIDIRFDEDKNFKGNDVNIANRFFDQRSQFYFNQLLLHTIVYLIVKVVLKLYFIIRHYMLVIVILQDV